jgi:dihydroflavonol-4-reductase
LIVVSGANGFLGSYVVCMLLEKGNKVRAFKRENSSLHEFEYIFSSYFPDKNSHQQLKNNLTWVIADVLDIPSLEDALTDVDEVYHCAAIVSFLQKHREKMMDVNVEGTKNMVNISLIKEIKKFCHVSSIAALGREKSGAHISEKSKWNESKNNSNYAMSKYKAEMEVWRGIEEGLNAVIVNPGVILGTGDWNKGSCKLFQMIWNGMPFYTLGTNGYVDVKDVSRAMIELVEKNISKERFVLVGENLQMKKYLDSVAGNFGKKKPTIEAGKFLSQIAWRVDALKSLFTGKEPSLTRETARASQNIFYYNSQKITEKITFQFTPMSKTIDDICTNFLKQQS